MGGKVGWALVTTVLVMCANGMAASTINAQEALSEFQRLASGPRGVGRGDWVFVPQLPSVFQIPRRDYDALGLTLGPWRLSSELGLIGAYDDNVFAEDEDTDADFIGTLEPAFRLRSDWAVHLLGVEGSARINRFADLKSEDSEEGAGTIFGRLDITGNDALFGSASFRRAVQRRTDPEDRGRDLTAVNRWIGRAGYVHSFARMNFRVDAQGRRLDFLEREDDDRDRNELDVEARLTYAWLPRISPFVETGYVIQDFDDPVDDTGVNRDAQVYSFGVGGTVLITEVLQGELAVGAFHADFDDPTLDSITSLGMSGDLVWNITRRTSIIGQARRNETPTTQQEASARIDTDLSIRLEHELLRNVLVFASGGYLKQEFRDIDRDDDRFRAVAGGEYLVNRFASFFAEYNFESRESNVEGRDFARNVALIGVRLQY